MATYQSHMSFSVLVSIGYVLWGLFFLNIYPELLLLAGVMVVIAGMLPNIDSGNGAPAKEVAGLLAAVSPIIAIEFFPGVKDGGVARVALIVICGYVFTRIVVLRGIQKFASPRGVVHSIPASIVVFELVYLLFWDLFWQERLFLGGAAFVGFFSHLVLDAYSNVDLLGRAFGGAKPKPAVLKFGGNSTASTVLVYCAVFGLGYLVFQDLSPHLAIAGRIFN